MSHSKIFSLPELIYEIIKFLHNDFSLLWEDPFSNPTKKYKFIEIYLQNLNDDDFKTKYKIYNDLPSNNTLFNYPSFIKYMNTCTIISSVEKWVKIKNNDFKKLIIRSLFKTFIENEVNLYTLEIESPSLINHDYFND